MIYRLGKAAARVDARTLKLTRYMTHARILHAPRYQDWTEKADCSYAEPWPMYGNDILGDCVPAASGHQIGAWTANAGDPAMPTPQQILHMYEKVGGYVPGDPSTDQGCNMLDALNYWRKEGLGGHKIAAYVSLDPLNTFSNGITHPCVEIMKAVHTFGGAYIGLQLPVTAQEQDVWAVTSLDGDGAPGTWGGHCVPVLQYSKTGVMLITWGQKLWASWAFIRAYCDEAYALLSKDWIEKDGLAPSGLDLPTLLSDLSIITA